MIYVLNDKHQLACLQLQLFHQQLGGRVRLLLNQRSQRLKQLAQLRLRRFRARLEGDEEQERGTIERNPLLGLCAGREKDLRSCLIGIE